MSDNYDPRQIIDSLNKFKEPAPSKAVEFHNKIVQKQMSDLEAKQAEERRLLGYSLPRASAPIKKEKVPLWHIPSQEYYLGYSSADGAIIISTKKGFDTNIIRIQNKKVAKTRDEEALTQDTTIADLVNGNGLSVIPSTFNNLSLEEFKQILAAKPKWEILQTAYSFKFPSSIYLGDVTARIDKRTATVVL